MKLALSRSVLVRTPRYPVNATLELQWEDLKECIKDSSPAFYSTIELLNQNDLSTAPEKLRYTIWKYFNRARFRSTPFGHFAALGLVPRFIYDNASSIGIGKMKAHALIDWSHSRDHLPDISQILAGKLKIISNSSRYLAGSQIRYISFADGMYQLSEIENHFFIQLILDFCRLPIAFSKVRTHVLKAGLDQKSFDLLVSALYESGLIITEKHPNVIGTDYFKRLAIPVGKKSYILNERSIEQVKLTKAFESDLVDYAHVAQRLCTNHQSADIEQFKIDFNHKFGATEVPLMLAMDPEMGIGYGQLAQEDGEEFTANFNKRKRSIEQTTDPLLAHFQNAYFQNSSAFAKALNLEDISIPTDSAVMPIPNTISALVTLTGNHVQLDHLGGSSAVPLSARFTHMGEDFLNHSKALAAIEQSSNPEVLFFDVGYSAELKVDNINRRKQIYDLNLNILNYDTSDKPLLLDDILVSVLDGNIILHSQQLGRRLIPRIASAYNYGRSDLSLFRFLGDLQHQQNQTQLGIDLPTLIPGLKFYPRLQFRSLIIAPARWMISPDQITKALTSGSLSSLDLPRYVNAGQADQLLRFDLQSAQEATYLADFLAKTGLASITEAFSHEASPVVDQYHQPYQAQLQLSLIHHDQIYFKCPRLAKFTNPLAKVIPPGDDWLYFEIFCAPFRADELLQNLISPFLDQQQSKIRLWFFVRYQEHGHHIRLRLQLKNPRQAWKLTSLFSTTLKQHLKTGIVAELTIRTYRREVERYLAIGIEQAEIVFHQDSMFITSMLNTNQDEVTKYHMVGHLIDEVRKSRAFNDAEWKQIFEQSLELFQREHQFSSAEYADLNKRYKRYSNLTPLPLEAMQTKRQRKFIALFVKALFQTVGDARVQLFGDLLHMHFNRLFSKNQRLQEATFYYIMVKKQLSARHRAH